jgi:hypothetical protein
MTNPDGQTSGKRRSRKVDSVAVTDGFAHARKKERGRFHLLRLLSNSKNYFGCAGLAEDMERPMLGIDRARCLAIVGDRHHRHRGTRDDSSGSFAAAARPFVERCIHC